MEKKTAKLIELLELTELRMSVTETESTVFEKIIPTIDIESDKYKTKRDCLVEELATAIASADKGKWGWIIISDNEEELSKGLLFNKVAVLYRHGKLEKDEYVRTFFQGRRVIKARSQSMGDRADWYVLAEPDSFNVLEISGRKNMIQNKT